MARASDLFSLNQRTDGKSHTDTNTLYLSKQSELISTFSVVHKANLTFVKAFNVAIVSHVSKWETHTVRGRADGKRERMCFPQSECLWLSAHGMSPSWPCPYMEFKRCPRPFNDLVWAPDVLKVNICKNGVLWWCSGHSEVSTLQGRKDTLLMALTSEIDLDPFWRHQVFIWPLILF